MKQTWKRQPDKQERQASAPTTDICHNDCGNNSKVHALNRTIEQLEFGNQIGK